MGRNGSGNELVAACCQWLFMHRIFHYRNNSGALRTEHGSFVRFGAKGSPDIVAVKDGVYVGLECKMGSGRQSPAQKDFQGQLERAGGKYFVVRSIDDLAAAFPVVR